MPEKVNREYATYTQDFSRRLIGLRTKQRLNQTDFAKFIGVSLRTVQNWEKTGIAPQPQNLRKLAATLKPDDFAYLLGEPTEPASAAVAVKSQETPPYKSAGVIVPLAHQYHRKVPVVSWARAGMGGVYGDLAGQIDEYLDTDCRDENAYALILEGDSMEPEFRAGDRVIFLPNTPPQNGDVVVARAEESGDVFFKLYHEFGKQNQMVRLTSYKDPPYPPIELHKKALRFAHPMHSMTRRRRRC